MTEAYYPADGLARRPHGSGDAWVTASDGRQFWGTFGAAGLLVHDPARGVLMQHRVGWSHFGETWALPGGARHEGESAIAGALREAAEEAGVPAEALSLAFTSVLDLGFWSYTTVVAHAIRSFEAAIGDAESLELRWILVPEVTTLPLHPGFAASWTALSAELERPIAIVVDAANVVGSRPDGWWRDRQGAGQRLVDAIGQLSSLGIRGAELGSPLDRWWPEFVVVTEGRAETVRAEAPASADGRTVARAVRVTHAAASGDDEIVSAVSRLSASEAGRVIVVTADRELRGRVAELGAETRGPTWLWGLLDGLAGP